MKLSKLTSALATLLFFCISATAQTNAQKEFKKLEWLTGTWNRTNLKPGQTASEIWLKVADGKLSGKGFTLKQTDTVFVEKLAIMIKDNLLFYVADVESNKAPTYFKITSISDNSFTSENPEHDFPKKITYQMADGKLKATISGNGKTIDFYFVKAKPN